MTAAVRLVGPRPDPKLAPPRASSFPCLTSGTWSRHTGATSTYDVVGLGFNYRIDDMHAALLLSRLARLEADIERRRELTRTHRR